MVTTTKSIKPADEFIGQCKRSEGGCSAIRIKVPNGKKKGEVVFKEVWQQSIVEFPNLNHMQCWGCKSKKES